MTLLFNLSQILKYHMNKNVIMMHNTLHDISRLLLYHIFTFNLCNLVVQINNTTITYGILVPNYYNMYLFVSIFKETLRFIRQDMYFLGICNFFFILENQVESFSFQFTLVILHTYSKWIYLGCIYARAT